MMSFNPTLVNFELEDRATCFVQVGGFNPTLVNFEQPRNSSTNPESSKFQSYFSQF